MNFLSRMRSSKKRRLILIVGAGALGLMIGVPVAAIVAASNASPGNEVGAPATPAPSAPTAPTAAPPETVYVPANFDGWVFDLANSAAVFAEAGNAHSGDISLRIDGQPLAHDIPATVLQQSIPVAPGTDYELTVWARSDASARPEVSLTIGDNPADHEPFAGLTRDWQPFTWQTSTEASQTELVVTVQTTGIDSLMSLDDISLLPTGGGDNAATNSSFETYSAATQLTNKSLIMETGAAYIGISARTASLSWILFDASDNEIDRDVIAMATGLGLAQFPDLKQGFYSIDLSDPTGAFPPLALSFAVFDRVEGVQRDERFGVGVHLDVDWYADSAQVAADLGLASARTDARWSNAEPAAGVYDFPAPQDEKVADYKAAGIELLFISDYNNRLYDGGKTPSSAEGISAYARYSSAIVEHFKQPALEIFNEFNNPGLNNSACGNTAECYLPLLRSASDQVKSDHPGTLILGPANARKDDPFLTELYALGGLDYLDVVTFHPYDYDYADNKGAEFLVESLQQAHNRIEEFNGGLSKPIWLTELGWSSTLVDSDFQQADYLVRSEVISLASGVERFYWYDLVNDHLHPLDHEGNFGMVRQKSALVPAFEPKLSAMAQGMLIRKIGGKEFMTRDELQESTYSYVFGEGGETTRVAWSTTPSSVSYSTKEPVTVTTQYGDVSVVKPVNGKVTIDLSEQTVYIDGVLRAATLVG